MEAGTNPNPKAAHFGAWLEAELKERRWNLSELARRSGWPGHGSLDPSNISKWVRGERIPSPQSCELIAHALGLPIDDVLTEAGHRPLGPGARPGSIRARLAAIMELIPEDKLEPLVPMLDGYRERLASRRGVKEKSRS